MPLSEDAQIINLTSHDICIFRQENEQTELIPISKDYNRYSTTANKLKIVAIFPKHKGQVPRCEVKARKLQNFKGIPIISYKLATIKDLPEEQDNIFYIVGKDVAREGRYSGRKDLLIPSYLVTNNENKVVGCMKLAIC